MFKLRYFIDVGVILGIMSNSLKIEKNKEILMRLQAPAHIVKSHFSEHEKVEGLISDKTQNSFLGCDRLLKYDTIFGTIQFAYDSRKKLTFLFANIKTSIMDTAASRYQKELVEGQMRNSLKTNSVNLAYSSKRFEDSASIFFKKDTKPWRESTVAPYLRRENLESLAKTMPFLQSKTQQRQRLDLVARDLALKAEYASAQGITKTGIAHQQHENLRMMETLNSIIARKTSMTNMFFNKINSVYDIQKKEIYNYYKNIQEVETQNLESSTQDPLEEDEE